MIFDSSQASYLSGAGALYDIAGALALGRGFLAISSAEMMGQASTGWGMNPQQLKVYAEQKYDARFGTALLAIGFLLQALSSLGERDGSGEAVLTLIPLIPVAVAYFYFRYSTTKRFAEAALETVAVYTPAERRERLERAFPK
jgi:hypothetical protein